MVPDKIAPEERLGRGVFSSKNKKRAQRKAVPFNIFLEKKGETDISVDRLDHVSPEKAAEIGDRVATSRKAKQFYGWAVVTANNASNNKRQVKATPQLDNSYHADIILPDLASKDREEQIQHAQELAAVSCWQDRPNKK